MPPASKTKNKNSAPEATTANAFAAKAATKKASATSAGTRPAKAGKAVAPARKAAASKAAKAPASAKAAGARKAASSGTAGEQTKTPAKRASKAPAPTPTRAPAPAAVKAPKPVATGKRVASPGQRAGGAPKASPSATPLPSPTETARDRAAKIAPILVDWTIGLARFNVLKDSKLREFLSYEAMLRGRSRGSHKGSGLRLDMKAAEQRASIEWMAKARGALVERCVEAARAVEKSAAFKNLTREFLAIAKAQGNAEAACAAPSEKTVAAAKAAQEKWLPAFIDAIASGVNWANESMDAAERRHGQSAAKKAVGLQALLRIEKAIDALDPQRLSAALDAGDLKTAKAGSAARHRDLFARAVNMGSNWRTSKEINDPNAKDPGPRQRFWAILDLLAPHGLDNAAPAAPGTNHPMWRTMLAGGQAATRWAARRPELTGDGQLQRLVEGWLNIKWSTPWEKIDALGQSAPKNLALEWLNAAPPDTMPLTRQRFLEEDEAEIAAAVEQGRAKAKAAAPESSSAEPPARKRRAGGAL